MTFPELMLSCAVTPEAEMATFTVWVPPSKVHVTDAAWAGVVPAWQQLFERLMGETARPAS